MVGTSPRKTLYSDGRNCRAARAVCVRYRLIKEKLAPLNLLSSISYMDSSWFARDFDPDIRRVCIFGFSMETLSPSPQCMRTPAPLWVDGLDGLKTDQVSPGRISSI
jgi:hypothetical protein